MSAILEFDNVHRRLDLLFLRALGLAEPTQWRLEGHLRQRYLDRELVAQPLAVATRRSGEVCIAEFMDGETPAALPEVCRRQANLDAALVRRVLLRKGRACTRVSVWLIYRDRGRFELQPATECLEHLLMRAHRAMRYADLPGARTAQISSLLPFMDDPMLDPNAVAQLGEDVFGSRSRRH